MTVCIVDPGPLGILLGALLHLKGAPVSFHPDTSVIPSGRIRVNLPDGRLLVEGIGRRTPAASPDFFLAMEEGGAMDREAWNRLLGRLRGEPNAAPGAVINGSGSLPERADPGMGAWEPCVVLADPVMLDHACIELPGPDAAIVTPRGSRISGLLSPLASLGFCFQECDDVGACLNSYRVLHLLDLPVAMCNTTRRNFLSFPEGREIAGHVLEEGLRTCAKLGERLGRLPSGDPAQLLGRLRRTPRAFDAVRTLPDRAYGRPLQNLMRGGTLEPRGCNRRIVERAAGAGLTLEWNWKLVQKVSRIHGAGFFAGPAELLSALV